MKDASHRVVVAPANRAYTRNQPEPVHEQNENEYRRKKPKCFAHQLASDNSFEKIVQTFDQPFPEVLDTAGDRFNSTRRYLCKNDNTSSHNPGHQHRVGNYKFANLKERRWLQRDGFVLTLGRRSLCCSRRRCKHKPAKQHNRQQ